MLREDVNFAWKLFEITIFFCSANFSHVICSLDIYVSYNEWKESVCKPYPQHEKCSESWCKWKKAQATGSLDSFHHKPALANEVFEAIRPIYKDLSRDELLTTLLGRLYAEQQQKFSFYSLALGS